MLKITLRQFHKLRSLTKIPEIQIANNERALQIFRHIHKSKTQYPHATFHQPPSLEEQKDSEYLVRLQNDSEIFGPAPHIVEEIDKDDQREERHIKYERQSGKKLSTKQYADLIKSLIAKKKLKEAIEIVEVKMIQEDRVAPENYLYNLLLGACGRVGYTKKAFQLYNDMKRRGLDIHPSTYTALFNACSNSPWTEDGLSRAKHLHNIIIEKRYEPNDSNYNAMIKAYGRCGDIHTAFCLVDEMIQKKFVIKDDTLNFLLQACITDKEAGFRHTLIIWHKFIEKRISPSVYSYNLLLRATRDCGLGDLDATKAVLKQILPESDKFLPHSESNESHNNEISNSNIIMPLKSEQIEGGLFEIAKELCPNETNRPNLLSETPYLGDVVLIDEITKPEDRLLLLGGYQNVLKDMEKNECVPNIKTFTQLLDCLPSTETAEKELLGFMKKNRRKADIDFYNMLIKKRSMRFDYNGAKEVLQMIRKDNFRPDLITYGVLALGCKNKEEAENFLLEMGEAKYRINAEILGAMFQQSTYHLDFPYVLFVMEQCVSENIPPNDKFMEHLDKFYKKCKRISNDSSSSLGKLKKFQRGYKIFRMRLKTWKLQSPPEEEAHPWQQFRQDVKTDVRHFKDTDKSVRFRARHTSLFRQKQVPTQMVTDAEKRKCNRKKRSWKPNKNNSKLDMSGD